MDYRTADGGVCQGDFFYKMREVQIDIDKSDKADYNEVNLKFV